MSVNWKLTDTKKLIYELIKSGVDSNSDIAQELNITKGVVSIHVHKLVESGLIKKDGQRYIAV